MNGMVFLFLYTLVDVEQVAARSCRPSMIAVTAAAAAEEEMGGGGAAKGKRQ